MSRRSVWYLALGGLAVLALIVAGLVLEDVGEGILESGVPFADGLESIGEWDNPCARFYEDVESEVGAEVLSARYGLPANLTVSGLGEIGGAGCMSGSDTGVEAVIVYRRVGDEVYSDYIIAHGGRSMDWEDWFAVTQPDVSIRPIEHGWTTEPAGLADGLPDQPVWEQLADAIREVGR